MARPEKPDNFASVTRRDNSNSATGAGKARLLRAGFAAALAAVAVDRVMPAALPVPAGGRLVAIAIGKAAVPMMAAAQARASAPLPGLVVAPHGHVPPGTGWPGVEIITAGHPLPDAMSLVAGERALALAAGLGAGDHLLMLVSGGGSAVLAAPVAGVSLAEKVAITAALLRSGAAIAEINTVRQALSRIKGGRLAAAAAPAAVTTWIMSDIPGDDPALVASGPTIAGGGGDAARAVLDRFGIAAPVALAGPVPVAAGDVRIIASARAALAAAGQLLAAAGYAVTDLGDALQGEARALGADHAALALRLAGTGRRHAIISGGETSVTMAANAGRGGRNLEYCLGLAIALGGAPGITALACDSDGIDGSSHAAGAHIGPGTLARGRALGLDAAAMLAANNSHGFFERLGDLLVTGPTLRNVNDIRIILVG
jgi:hydroxypyruvate reductase